MDIYFDVAHIRKQTPKSICVQATSSLSIWAEIFFDFATLLAYQASKPYLVLTFTASLLFNKLALRLKCRARKSRLPF